jgi:spore coat polysaccharide biosynthesis protein SpsF
MRDTAILQARMTSSRLPGKVMKIVNGEPMIYWQIQRILKSKVGKLIVATSSEETDDLLAAYIAEIGIEVYRGSINDVFSRFMGVINNYDGENFIRLTADCPLIMPNLLNLMIDFYHSGDYDYVSNTLNRSFPDGLDIEIIRTSAFQRLSQFELSDAEIEHVTLGMYSRPEIFKCENYSQGLNMSELRWTVDYPEDLDFVKFVFSHFIGKEADFNFENVLDLLDTL